MAAGAGVHSRRLSADDPKVPSAGRPVEGTPFPESRRNRPIQRIRMARNRVASQ